MYGSALNKSSLVRRDKMGNGLRESGSLDFCSDFVGKVEETNWPIVSKRGRRIGFGNQSKEIGVRGDKELLHCFYH